MDIRQLKTDAHDGKLSVDQLLDIVEKQQKTIEKHEATIRRLTERLAQYEPEARREFTDRKADAEKPSESYSMEAECKRRRQRKRRRK